jgi:hypothetical protein
VKRSVEKAICRPSGDQTGCRSLYASLVSGVRTCVSRSNTCRLSSPPVSAAKTMRRPSGDHEGVKISPSSANSYSASRRPVRASTMVSTGCPRLSAAKANRRLSGAQSPAELRNCRLSKCGSPAVRTSRRSMRPVSTSARYMSIEKSDRSERNTTCRPSRLMAGARFRRPPEPSSLMTARAMRSTGSAASITGCRADGWRRATLP